MGKMTIWFDMDGTLADLYNVTDWLSKLRAYDASPYEQAEVMHNMNVLARYLNMARRAGYEIGIISWLSKEPQAEYDEAVIQAKLNWLHLHLNSVNWDYIRIVAHGTPKSTFMNSDLDILFDDEEKNRKEWRGSSYSPTDIMKVLKELVKEM